MSDDALSARNAMASSVRTSIYAGLLAGTVDLGAACLINGVSPGPILRFIATGLLGTPISHEPWVYCLGLIAQWAMSIVIAGIFVFASVRFATLWRRPMAAGIAYGVMVYVVMTFVVVPLSRAKAGHSSATSDVENLLAMIVFGLIIAYTFQKLYRQAS